MHYYKILKHKAGFDEGTSYWEKLLARYLAATGGGKIHTTLPITFTSTSWKLASWTIYGNNTPNNYSAEGTLPLTFTTHTAGEADAWSISGNDEMGKNLLKNTGTTIERYGVTFTKNADGTVVANGTSTSNNCIFVVGNVILEPDKTYIYTGCPAGGGDQTTYCLYFGGRGADWADFGEGKTLPAVTESTTLSARIIIYNGTTVENLIFKPMVRPADTSATFEPYQIGVGQRTKNLISLAGATQTTSGTVEFTIDETNGVVTANGTCGSTTSRVFLAYTPSETQYVLFSGCPAGGSGTTYDIYCWDVTTGARCTRWDGTTQSDADYGDAEREAILPAGHQIHLVVRIMTNYTADNLVFRPMFRLRGSDVGFIPFGYEIPLTVNNTTQDIYIGSTPLTAGQSISKTSTGVDIAAIAGTNTIGTTLYNKPEMSIEGVDYVGVGERTKNLYNIDDTDVNNGYVHPGRLRPNGTINQGSIEVDVWVTEYIAVEPERAYTLVDLIQTSAYGICYYNASKTYLSGEAYNVAGHGNKTITTPADCKYIRFTVAEGYGTMLVAGSTAPATFVPYGYEVPLDIRHKTKNLLEITTTSTTINGVTFTVDKEAGTITANGTASANARLDFHTMEMTVNATDIVNGIPSGATSSTYYILVEFENGTNAFGSNLDNTAIGDRPNFTPRVLGWRIYVLSGQTVNNLVFKPMLRPADTTPEFEPYYLTNHEDIYIGDSPLTEGQTVSNTTEIEVFEGENTIDTTLYNKPEMEIIYE